jgi:glutamine amidotransferase
MSDVVIVKYNAGNIRSVSCALHRLGVDPVVSDDPKVLVNAKRVIFPGVGEASTAMEYLRKTHLDEVLLSLTQPFLGICLGMQLMCSLSEENKTTCLGMYDLTVTRFKKEEQLKIPHMGWNTLACSTDPLFAGVHDNPWVYFVHSYYVPSSFHTIASCTYGSTTFSAALGKDNFRGVQFHPEKSGPFGSAILQNFLQIKEDAL